jgi:hypothetical protein
LSGCAGRNFVKPETGSLTLNKTTYQNVVTQFGKPYQEGSQLKNEKMIKDVTYAYSSVGGTPVYEYVTPARAMAFHFFNDILVGYEFTSSFKEDHSDFDELKLDQIKKGESTKSQVISLIGEPTGEYVFPMIKIKEAKAVVYMYSHFKKYKIYQKNLIITIKNDIVVDVEFTTSGEK